MKKLLIFDLNKVLICKNKHRRTSYFLRPNAVEFVNEMMSLYEVAVWTSGKVDTMSHAMNTIFGQKRDHLLFYWTQQECTKVNEFSSSFYSSISSPEWNTILSSSELSLISPPSSSLCSSPEFIPPRNTDESQTLKKSKRKEYSVKMFKKDLTKVWEKYPQYNQHNTILLDDSPDKMELNPPFTSICPKKFDVYDLCEKYELQRLSGVTSNDSSRPPKRGLKRGREVSKYQRYGELDEELRQNSPLWKYLTELAAYPGPSDEYISQNEYLHDEIKP